MTTPAAKAVASVALCLGNAAIGVAVHEVAALALIISATGLLFIWRENV